MFYSRSIRIIMKTVTNRFCFLVMTWKLKELNKTTSHVSLVLLLTADFPNQNEKLEMLRIHNKVKYDS